MADRGTSALAGRDLLSLGPDQLEDVFTEMGVAPYRGRQLFRGFWHTGINGYEELSVFPKDLRRDVAQRYPLIRARAVETEVASDGTTKFLLELADGNRVETVLLPHPYGNSVCVSTQIGCAMGCHFCASGLLGKRRNCTPGEMLEQVRFADAALRERGEGGVTHVDLMGIGEPLDNYDNVVQFLKLVHHPEGFNLSYRRLTVSTSGLVPKIYDLAAEGLPVTLAVSLHAPTDALRLSLMPVNRAYPLAKLMPAVRAYFEATGRRVTFEYAMIRGVNDGLGVAEDLAHLLGGLPCHVNLIPWNPVSEHPFQPTPPEDVAKFQAVVQAAGISCTIRKELGQEIDAACGQLRHREEGTGHPEGSRPNPSRAGAHRESRRLSD